MALILDYPQLESCNCSRLFHKADYGTTPSCRPEQWSGAPLHHAFAILSESGKTALTPWQPQGRGTLTPVAPCPRATTPMLDQYAVIFIQKEQSKFVQWSGPCSTPLSKFFLRSAQSPFKILQSPDPLEACCQHGQIRLSCSGHLSQPLCKAYKGSHHHLACSITPTRLASVGTRLLCSNVGNLTFMAS